MLDSDLKFILGSTYNDEFFTNGSNYRESLEKNGILIFKSFISDSGLKLLQNDANELKKYSYKSSSEYNVYISEHDNNFSKNSPRNRIMSTSKKCISNDLKQTMLNKHKILINSKFHRTSFLPAYTMEKKLIDKTLDRFINTFKKLSTDNYRKYK